MFEGRVDYENETTPTQEVTLNIEGAQKLQAFLNTTFSENIEIKPITAEENMGTGEVTAMYARVIEYLETLQSRSVNVPMGELDHDVILLKRLKATFEGQ